MPWNYSIKSAYYKDEFVQPSARCGAILSDPWTQLETTARALLGAAIGRSEAGEQLLPPGVQADRFAWTALHYAAAAGIKPLVEQLLHAGSPIDYKGHEDYTPLMCAVKYQHPTVVELLVKHGAGFSAEGLGRLPSTSLHRAAALGHLAIIELLLQNGVAVNGTCHLDMSGDTTALHEAARAGHVAVVKLLLAKGATIDTLSCSGRTPLHHAAIRGHTTVVEVLLAKGAAVNAVDLDCWTPLHEAAAQGHLAITELLLAKGAAVDAVEEAGKTPLHCAASGGRAEVARFLISKGAAVDAPDLYGNTPLTRAVDSLRQSDTPFEAVHAAEAVAALAKAVFLTDKTVTGQLLADVDTTMLHMIVEAVFEGWCSPA